MIPVLSQNDTFTLDEITVSSNYLSAEKLMDNAGQNIAQFIVENIPNAKKWRNKVTIDSVQGSLTINKLKNYALELESIDK